LSSSQAILEFISVSKYFDTEPYADSAEKTGRFAANKDISFSVKKGSIHAIIGENGAGKSTLMKMLFGLYPVDAGKILLHGQEILFQSPIDAKNAGLGMVHQHFMLAEPISALDHIILDQKIKSEGFFKNIFNWLKPLPRKQIEKSVLDISSKFNMPLEWDKKVEDLPIGMQQRLEILKLLYNEAEILILDEPTAVLTPQEIEGFFLQLRELRKAGKTILIITHKLKEVLSLADDFSILRQGQLIHTGKLEGQTVQSLGELMIGRKPKDIQNKKTKDPLTLENQQTVLKVENLSYSEENKSWLSKVNFQIKAGEIVGLAGVEGNGQSQLLDLLFRPLFRNGKKQGSVQILKNETLHLTNIQIRKLGVNELPEDRLKQALMNDYSARENFLLGQQWRTTYSNRGWLKWNKISNDAKLNIEKNDVRPTSLTLPLSRFSGGNQQKFVVGRELSQSPKLLIAAQPTRGVDIGAIESIHSEILKQKASGAAVFLVSSELEELMRLSDRIYVIFQGQILAHLYSGEFDEKKIGAFMGGATSYD